MQTSILLFLIEEIKKENILLGKKTPSAKAYRDEEKKNAEFLRIITLYMVTVYYIYGMIFN